MSLLDLSGFRPKKESSVRDPIGAGLESFFLRLLDGLSMLIRCRSKSHVRNTGLKSLKAHYHRNANIGNILRNGDLFVAYQRLSRVSGKHFTRRFWAR